MLKLFAKTEEVEAALRAQLAPEERLLHGAVGFKMVGLFVALFLSRLLPFLVEYYLVGLTDRRLLLVRVASPTNFKVKGVREIGVAELRDMQANVIGLTLDLSTPTTPLVIKFSGSMLAGAIGNEEAAGALLEGLCK